MTLRFSISAASFAALVALASPARAGAPTIDTAALHAVVVDFDTGTTLFDKGADERIEPASLSKMMTAYVVFGYIKAGQAKLTDTLPVTEEAWAKHKTDESNMFVALGSRVQIEDLIRGMIVQSGNDACYVLAEGLAGSLDAFIQKMNDTAKQLGMTNTHYANVDGLPDPQEYTTARDLSIIATHLIRDYPEYHHYESEKDFTYNGIKQGNRNPLLYKDPSVDGIKTGHTEEAGYGVAISALRENHRMIEILTGMKSMRERSDESEKVLDWAYRTFANYKIVKAGDPLDDAPVWLGEQTKVAVTSKTDIILSLPRTSRRDLKVMAHYDGPVKAPVHKGDPVGKLEVTLPGMPEQDYPLVAVADVPQLGTVGRVAAAAGYLLWGKH